MSQLLVRNIEEKLVLKLKRRATAHGVSVEEEHRRILREALSRPAEAKPSLMEFLLSDGSPWPDNFIPPRARDTGKHRKVEF